jgi:acetyltransferase-like isoleucine patch superfamily enzyme
MASLVTVVRRGRAVERRIRAKAWAAYPEVTVGRGVKIGRGCRLILDPGSRIVLGDGCEIDDGTTLAAYGGTIDFGPGCFVGHHCTIASGVKVSFGPGVFLGEMVSVRDHDHDTGRAPSSGVSVTASVHIGAGAWLGCKVTVLRGATIGERAVIGANAVVRGDIPARVIAVGIPARVARALPPDD